MEKRSSRRSQVHNGLHYWQKSRKRWVFIHLEYLYTSTHASFAEIWFLECQSPHNSVLLCAWENQLSVIPENKYKASGSWKCVGGQETGKSWPRKGGCILQQMQFWITDPDSQVQSCTGHQGCRGGTVSICLWLPQCFHTPFSHIEHHFLSHYSPSIIPTLLNMIPMASDICFFPVYVA